MDNLQNKTKEELQERLNILVSEYEEYKDIMRQAYTEMESRANEYNLINKELESRQ